MARGGIYKSEVVRARANLLSQGRYPSVDAIRIELGNTGSKSTIQRYLKEIEEEQGGRAVSATGLSDAIKDLAARMAEQLQSEADQRIAELQVRHATELREAREAAAAAQKETQTVKATVDQLRDELASSQVRFEDLNARYMSELQARSTAQQQAADIRLQLEAETAFRGSLETKYSDARRALEHFREAAKEQREGEARKHENQVQFFQQEIRCVGFGEWSTVRRSRIRLPHLPSACGCGWSAQCSMTRCRLGDCIPRRKVSRSSRSFNAHEFDTLLISRTASR